MTAGRHENPVYLYALEVLSACGVCYLLYRLIPGYHLIWAVIYVPLVISPIREKSRALVLGRIQANFLGALLGFAVLVVFGQNFFAFAAGAAAIIGICSTAKFVDLTRSALLTLVAVTVPHYAEPSWGVALERIVCVTCGCLIALAAILAFEHLHGRFAAEPEDSAAQTPTGKAGPEISGRIATAIYMAEFFLASGVAYLLVTLYPQHRLVWAMTSIALVLSPKSAESQTLIYDRIKANLLGAAVGYVALVVHEPIPVPFFAGVVLVVFLSRRLSIYPTVRTALVAFAILVVPEYEESRTVIALERMVCVGIGCLIALATTLLADLLLTRCTARPSGEA